jgi:hypothetical protein
MTISGGLTLFDGWDGVGIDSTTRGSFRRRAVSRP